MIHRLTYRRTNHHNIHVRGYKEEGTTTTPFDMVMLNDLDRFHLVMDVSTGCPGLGPSRPPACARRWPTRACARAPTRARSATICPRSATGPGRRGSRAHRRRLGRQLTRRWRSSPSTPAPAASSSRLVGEDDRVLADEELAAPQARVDSDSSAARWRVGSPAPRRSPTASCTAATATWPRRSSTPRSAAASASCRIWRRCTSRSPWLRSTRCRRPARVPAVACFDTAFHATLPPAAFTYALPARWRERWGLRRFGFHGLSHAWVARWPGRSSAQAERRGRIVSCHLGAGASLCAIAGERSVDTTMGFTPLEGLVMATRSGSVDPGLLLWLLEREAIDAHEMATRARARVRDDGLAGEPDMRVVLGAPSPGDAAAALAVDVYVHRLCAGIAAMTASLGGIDVLVFTGGVGENAPAIRARAALESIFSV